MTKTDIEFSAFFKGTVAENYKVAIEFLSSNPDYSLLKFREIICSICIEIAEYHKLDYGNIDGVFERIEYLYDCQIIHKEFKNNLHQARKFSNYGMHQSSINKDNKNIIKDRRNFLVDKAKEVRKLIVDIFKDTCLINNKEIPLVNFVSLEVQEYREILFDASISQCDRKKLKAGIIYEKLIEDINTDIGTAIIIPSNLGYHIISLYKIAKSYYEASYKISANIDDNLDFNKDDKYKLEKTCKLEPLFRYSVIEIEIEKSKKGEQAMKIAADRMYAPAEAYYGSYLYEKKEYELSLQYLKKAVKKEEAKAFLYLFYYFSEGLACEINKELSLKYLNEGISLGYPDLIGALGIAYHKGVVIEKNDIKAEQYLKKAINLGSFSAQQYFTIEYNDLVGTVAKKIQDFVKNLSENLKPKPILRGEKIGRNQLCPCGSGNKYKKCHGK